MLDVARRVGVSKNTVSLALRGSLRISEEVRTKVGEAAEAMGYRLDPTVAELMARLRKSGSPGFQATLAMVNANQSPDAFRSHPTVPAYVGGCVNRARQLGYELDEFWLHDPGMSAGRLGSILRARNIRGILLVGLMEGNRLPVTHEELWREHPVVVTGVRTREPAFSFACSDHHALALEAYERVEAMGYRRPALVLDRVIDELTEGRFTAGFLTGQSRTAGRAGKTKPFYDVQAARDSPELFHQWLERNRPDVIFTLYHEVRRWLTAVGLRVPEDIGLVQYEWRADHRDWAGMDQRNDLVGEAAVDMLISMIHHRESGVMQPRATMIGSRWVEGGTVRMQEK